MRPLATVVVHRERLVAEAIASALDRSAAIAVVEAGAIAPSRVAGLEVAVVDADLPDAELTVARLRAAGVKVVALGTGVRADVQVPADGSIGDLTAAVAPSRAEPAGRPLSPREREVLLLVAEGLGGKQVARALGISPKTVEHHKTRAFAKLGVPNQAAAVAALMEEEYRWNRRAI